MFPKVSVKRSLQNSSPITVRAGEKADDYNNNDQFYRDNNHQEMPDLIKNPSMGHENAVVDDSSFHSIELNSHSISSQTTQNDDRHSITPKPVHTANPQESLPNID